MTTCAELTDRRFGIQQITEATWLRATAANAAADALYGNRELVDGFLAGHPEFQRFRHFLANEGAEALAEYVNTARSESLGFLTLMLTGACNANCGICFTDRRKKPNELTPQERAEVLAEAKALGAEFVYVPGEGEPTIDHGWWDFLDACRELDLPAIVFTNGMSFADDELAGRMWGISSKEAVERLADYPVHMYVKYWTTDQQLAARLLSVPATRLPYGEVDGVPVPLGLQRLMDALPRDRVGIEAVVERRTADAVADTIAPFTDQNGLSRIIEMIQHNGRTFGDPSYDPTPEQAARCGPLLSPTSCMLATCKGVVTVQGYLSPRIAVLEHQLPEDRVSVRDGDLFELLHSTDYIVSRRYTLSCLCETIPLELAGAARGSVLAPLENVTAPALAAVGAIGCGASTTDASGGCAGACGGGGCGSVSGSCGSLR